MKKYTKAGLLIVTLVIPALIFTFLRYFATNHYNVPYFFPLKDRKGNIEMVGKDTLYYSVGNFKATISAGQALDEHFVKGTLTVLNYLPKDCNDSCQVLQNTLERIYDLRSNIDWLNLITIADSSRMVSSDSQFASPRQGWSFIQVAPDELKEVLGKFRFGTPIPKAKVNSIESKLVLIDGERYIRGYYNGYDPEEINRLMAEIKILDFEKKESSNN